VDTGWEHVDDSVRNDGTVWWDVVADFDATGGILGNAAALGYQNNPCCEELDGYGNDWYQAIRIEYEVAADVSFDYLLDSEAGFDFLQVEVDSGCASFDLVDYDAYGPGVAAEDFRWRLFSDSGYNLAGVLVNQPLIDYGTTSCLYIAFFSDGGWSPCDGLQSTVIGRAIVVDNIVLVDGNGTRIEDFTSGSITIGTFENIAESVPFGTWARVYKHITDNDICVENTTCAWLWTDDGSFDGNPTLANDPSMAFGPGGFVVRNWLDDIIVSPWVSLATTPTATGTVIQFRRFPGNSFRTSRIVQNWSVRGKGLVDDGMGGTTACVSVWGHAFRWNSLSLFRWQTLTWDMSSDFNPTSEQIQIRHRTSDWQWISGAAPPNPFVPGPGPYIDRTRIGRITLTGPVIDEGIDARYQAQDAFPTEIHPDVTPGTGEHFRPTTDRFGTVAFSASRDMCSRFFCPNLITGDSVTAEVRDVRGAGGILSVDWYGTLVEGPHQGKAPPPWSVGANGFFQVPAEPARSSSGSLIEGRWFVDLDDFYFRGGDILHYVWLAGDALGGVSSLPTGLSSIPTSVAEAQEATQGMYEVSFLPQNNWDPGYLQRIQNDDHGDLEPTPTELASTTQANCILYVSHVNWRRRSGDVNRTSFMYTLDSMGYRGHYDVYDHMGMGNTNNQLGGRATVQQAEGYSLIVYDAGNRSPGGYIVPDGSDNDGARIDQAGWFQSWLEQGLTSEAGSGTLWLLGSNVLEEHPTNPLYTATMGAVLNGTNQGLSINPDVQGQGSFLFSNAAGTQTRDFSSESFALSGGCPTFRDYDALGTTGGAVITHVYQDPQSGTEGDGAIVMNSSPADRWNTILQSHAWFDIHDATPSSPSQEKQLVGAVLSAVLPLQCQQAGNPTDVPEVEPSIDSPPLRTELHSNVPNPFNPTTRIEFDLAHEGQVSLRIYDVAGRLVRTLIDASLTPGRYTGQSATVWDGTDDTGQRVSSGVYFYRLTAPDYVATRKMILMR
jgi:hypothetical protein